MGIKNFTLADFLISDDVSECDSNNQPTEQEKEHSLFVKMCYLISGDKKVYDLTEEEWSELEKYGMVTSEKRKMGIRYYATEKALQYVEGVNSDYAIKVLVCRENDNVLWDICESSYHTVDGVKVEIGKIIKK